VRTWSTSGVWSGDREVVTVTGLSPFTFANAAAVPVVVFVSGGTGLVIEFSRDGLVWAAVGLVGGQYRLNPGDALRLGFVVAPTLVQYPL
jgi:hypothetical protein